MGLFRRSTVKSVKPPPPPPYMPEKEQENEFQSDVNLSGGRVKEFPVLPKAPVFNAPKLKLEEDEEAQKKEYSNNDSELQKPPVAPVRPILETTNDESKNNWDNNNNNSGIRENQDITIAPIKFKGKIRDVRTVDETGEVFVDPTTHRPKFLAMDQPQPLFVSVSDYQTILDGIDNIKHGLGQTEGHVAKIVQLKEEQEKSLEEWRNQLEDVQKKLSYIDEVLFEIQ